MEWLNFRHLYAFWAVCRHGGFGKAAQRIFVSQSTVSQQVAQLEDYLGEALVERTTRAVHVTDRGAALLRYADRIFARSAEINAVFRDKQESVTPSSIRIGMVGGISRNFIFNLISRNLGRERPPRVEVADGSFDELTALLKSFELDLIFSLDRPRHKDLMTLSHARVEASPVCLAGTPARVERARRGEGPVELYLLRHPFEGAPLDEVIADAFGWTVTVPVWTDDISLLRFLATGGRGLAVVPQMGVQADLDAGRLARLALPAPPQVEVYASYLTRGVRRQLIDRFLG